MKLLAQIIATLVSIEFLFVIGITILGCTVDMTWVVIASGVVFVISCIIACKID